MILEYITLKISIFILYIETWLQGSGSRPSGGFAMSAPTPRARRHFTVVARQGTSPAQAAFRQEDDHGGGEEEVRKRAPYIYHVWLTALAALFRAP